MDAKALKAKLNLRYEPDVYRNLGNAQSSCNNRIKPHWIVLGDNDGENALYLVVCPADASKLEKSGYEIL